MRAFVFAVLLVSAPAQAQMEEAILDLGDGLAVARLCPVGPLTRRACFGWRPVGFSFGEHAELLTTARTFFRSPSTGAILAIFGRVYPRSRVGSYIASGGRPRMMRTTDGGQHWTEVRWDWSAAPTVIAFDRLTPAGVAIGELGHVWSTPDGGEHWTDHGGSWSSRWVDVAIAAGEIVLLDSRGGVFRSSDGGFRREAVITDPTARLEQRDTEIIVHTKTADYVVVRGASVRRMPP